MRVDLQQKCEGNEILEQKGLHRNLKVLGYFADSHFVDHTFLRQTFRRHTFRRQTIPRQKLFR